jgi:hypothetical protein
MRRKEAFGVVKLPGQIIDINLPKNFSPWLAATNVTKLA